MLFQQQNCSIQDKRKNHCIRKSIHKLFWTMGGFLLSAVAVFCLLQKQGQRQNEAAVATNGFNTLAVNGAARDSLKKMPVKLNRLEPGARLAVKEEKTGKVIGNYEVDEEGSAALELGQDSYCFELKKQGYLPAVFYHVTQESIQAFMAVNMHYYSVSLVPEEKLVHYQENIAAMAFSEEDRGAVYELYSRFLNGEEECYDPSLGERKRLSEYYDTYLSDNPLTEDGKEEGWERQFLLFDFDGNGVEELFLKLNDQMESGYDFCIGATKEGSLQLYSKFETGARWTNSYYKNGIFFTAGSSGAQAHGGDLWQCYPDGTRICLYASASLGVGEDPETTVMIERNQYFVKGLEFDIVEFWPYMIEGLPDIRPFVPVDIFNIYCKEDMECKYNWRPVSEAFDYLSPFFQSPE